MNKKTQEVLFSSKDNEWATPQGFYNKLNTMFGPFTLDPASTKENAKCSKFYTVEDDGLKQDWSNNVIYNNPPYGKDLKRWVEKGYLESLKPNTKVVMLLPARTDTKSFHQYCMKAYKIYFVKGRLKFGDSKNSAPFPSMVVVFDSGCRNLCINDSPYFEILDR